MPDPMQLDSLRPGTQLNGIYEIDRLVASGGMGEVYKSHSIQTGDAVAIKVIRNEFADNELVRSMFRNEASSLHNLHHEAIVRYFIFAVDPTLGRAYLAMDFVEGESLSQLLRSGPLPLETVARLGARIANGLHAAHRQGITHRDISPDNIIIQGGDVGQATIIDFGIARATRAGEETIVDVGFAGKYNYVSPEQLGEYGGDVTPKSDIYSLGLVLAAALRGAPIDMSGRPAEVITKRRGVPPLDDIDPRARPLLTRMLQPVPTDRFESMLEVARTLENLARQPEKKATLPDTPRPAARPRPVLVGAAILLAVGAVAGGGAFYLWPRPEAGPVGGGAPIEAEAPSPVETTARSEADEAARRDMQRIEQISRFLADYRGGPCVRIVPGTITSTAAPVEAFALKRTILDELDRAFLSEFGFEAQIRAMIIEPAQCPVLAFLDHAPTDPKVAPRIELTGLTHSVVPAGQPLSGSVEGVGSRKLALLLVSPSGRVENVTEFLRPGPERSSFAIPVARPMRSNEPVLLLALTSDTPLAVLAEAARLPSDKFFEKLLDDRQLASAHLGVAVAFFYAE